MESFPAIPRASTKLDDCRRHGIGSGAELFIVEGDSAAGSVRIVRDPETQAVLPIQGKPLNAAKAAPARVAAYPLFQAIVEAMGAGDGPTFDIGRARYERVVLLMDADADGIHCAALMCLYFFKRMWPLLDAGRIAVAHAPLAAIAADADMPTRYVWSETEYCDATSALRAAGHEIRVVRYRGLAGLDLGTLAEACVRPATRTLHPLSGLDADVTLRFIGRGEPHPRLF